MKNDGGQGSFPGLPLTALLVGLGMLCGLPSATSAEKLYKYRDAKGTWCFSDRPPAGEQPVEIRQRIIDALPKLVTVRQTGSKATPTLLAINQYHGPVEVEIGLTEARNIQPSCPLPARFVVPAAKELSAVTIRPQVAADAWSYAFTWRFVPGDPAAVHRPAAPYRLPFPKGRTCRVSQAFKGAKSHSGPQNQYAVDLVMAEGTPVLAARGGMVMEVAQDFFGGGTDDPRFRERANFVRVLHDDGTMAIYAHLKLETCQVVPGMRVKAGQLLAASGNTGYSSGPHLHFAVHKNAGMHLVSVPFLFADPGRGTVTPEAGMVLGGGAAWSGR